MKGIYFEEKGEALLEQIGMTKAEFARRMGIRRQNVKALLKTRNLDIIHKASEVLGVPFLMLVGYVEPVEEEDTSFNEVPLDINLLCSEPVCNMTGHEFEPVEGKTFIEQVADYFAGQGGSAQSPFGVVELDRKGIKNSFYHGMSMAKRCAFAAIKDVLEKGCVILPMGGHKGEKKEQTGMVAAPVMIGGERYVCVVVVIYNLRISPAICA